MNEKHAYESGHAVAGQRVDAATARVAADTRRRWDEVRQARELVMSRQEQVIQQTRADVRRHVERMRNVRAAIISPEAPRVPSATKVEASAVVVRPAASIQTPIAGPRFDFDARRVLWEQRRREQAEKRREEIAKLNEPYQAQRRMLEEKRRQALLDQQAARQPHVVGAHQLVRGEGAIADTSRDVETIVAINVVVEPVSAPVAPVREDEPARLSGTAFRQSCLFADEA